MNALLDHTEEHSGDVVTFWFKPERRIHFSAGQYVELYLPHEPCDDRGTRRWFTISSSPNEADIAITVGFPPKASSFKQTLQALRPGVTVSLSDPLGDFVLPKDTTIPLVFIAAGTGSTPYASMVKWLQERDEARDVQLIYSTSSPDMFLFSELWKTYKPLQLVRMISHTDSTWDEHIGHLNIPMILETIGGTGDKLVYLAGPQSLIEPLHDQLLMHIPRSRILLDYFPGY
jgi:ferredoxin-NADP reductase